MAENKKIINRARVVFLCIGLFSLFIVGKILVIQFVDGEKWKTKVVRITTDLREIKPVRGNIYAGNGDMLATSIPIYEIRMDMMADGLSQDRYDANIDSLAICLSIMFEDLSPAQYKARFKKAKSDGNRYLLVQRDVTFEEMTKAQTFPLWRDGRFKSGAIFEKRTVRLLPFKDLAARTVGYQRESSQPVGLEGAYDSDLRGRPGERYEKRLPGGIWMPLDNNNEVEPRDGSDIYTSIDVNIQDVATTALRRQLTEHHARHGSAVLMEVKTGYIKAIANLTMNSDSTYSETYNYAVGEATEPGSVFKLASLMAAFEDGKLTLTDSVDTRDGTYRFYDRIMRDSNKKGYGTVDVLTSFQKSSNVAISRLINEKYAGNPQHFVNRVNKLGLGSPLGLEISGEGIPKIKSPSDPSWSGVTLPWMSIGYEMLMTPLQILTFYNAVANDGVMVRPLFVQSVRQNGKIIRENEPQIINKAIASRSTILMAKTMLESVVAPGGTASNLLNKAYTVAGKTGTAQIANAQYGYKYEEAVSYQASFVGYFPAEAPEYSCIVVVNGPSNDVYYGNQVAGPVFKEIADKVMAQRLDLIKEIQPTDNLVAVHVPVSMSGNADDLKSIFSSFNIGLDDKSEGYDWVTTSSGQDIVTIARRSVTEGKVPNVVGMGLRDGLYLLEQSGLRVKISGTGMITKQSIVPGAVVPQGGAISIELS